MPSIIVEALAGPLKFVVADYLDPRGGEYVYEGAANFPRLIALYCRSGRTQNPYAFGEDLFISDATRSRLLPNPVNSPVLVCAWSFGEMLIVWTRRA